MPEVDAVLLAAVDLARSALAEITPPETVGEPIGHVVEDDHVVSLLFESKLPGYVGWHWTVSLSRLDDASEPSVLETELMPSDRALLAPDWVPWSERMADYRAAQDAAALAAESASVDEGGDDDDIDEFDSDDLGDDDLDDVDLGEEDLDEEDLEEEDLEEDEDLEEVGREGDEEHEVGERDLVDDSAAAAADDAPSGVSSASDLHHEEPGETE